MHKPRVKTQPGLASCAARKRHRKRCLLLVNVFGKNRTALNCSIQFLQQSSVQAARGFAQGVPKTGCLDKLASERREACAVSKALFAVLSLALALQCSLLTRSKKIARDWPSPCPLTLTLTQTQTQTPDCASSSFPEQRLPQILNEV